ncbi:hypothetical protein CRYUN_Cryun12cG0144500 [Craigia yunnanensis]
MNASLCYFGLTAELLPCSKFRILEEILTIEIKPGWKRGTKMTFLEKGNEEPGKIPSDEITLLEALTGKTLDLITLDGRNLMIPLTDIIKPGAEVVVPNEGMPISREPGRKGDLRIKLDQNVKAWKFLGFAIRLGGAEYGPYGLAIAINHLEI